MWAREAAEYLDTDDRTLRRFVRSSDFPKRLSVVGRAGRYNFSEAILDEIKELFEAWQENKICEETANPGTWPYVTRCVRIAGHKDMHRDRKDRKWE